MNHSIAKCLQWDNNLPGAVLADFAHLGGACYLRLRVPAEGQLEP
jgi:hypothetical protein